MQMKTPARLMAVAALTAGLAIATVTLKGDTTDQQKSCVNKDQWTQGGCSGYADELNHCACTVTITDYKDCKYCKSNGNPESSCTTFETPLKCKKRNTIVGCSGVAGPFTPCVQDPAGNPGAYFDTNEKFCNT